MRHRKMRFCHFAAEFEFMGIFLARYCWSAACINTWADWNTLFNIYRSMLRWRVSSTEMCNKHARCY